MYSCATKAAAMVPTRSGPYQSKRDRGSGGCSSKHMAHSSCKCSSWNRHSSWSRESRCKSSNYDHPALYSSEDQFSEASYWDQRYCAQGPQALTFEWYRSYESLAPVLTRHLPKDQAILQIGVGTSVIQEDMVLDGYCHIVNVDYSQEATRRMRVLHAHLPQLEYQVADARSMPQFPPNSFAGVLDKGTLDALLCGDCADADAAALLQEAARVLQRGACYVMVTSAGPAARLPFLLAYAPVPLAHVHSAAEASTSNSAASDGWFSSNNSRSGAEDVGRGDGEHGVDDALWQSVLVYEVGQQGALGGPYEVGRDAEVLLSLPRMPYSHFVYVSEAR